MAYNIWGSYNVWGAIAVTPEPPEPVPKTKTTIKGVQASIATVVADMIGDQLSSMGAPGQELPSVFLANSRPPRPNTPYATVRFIGSTHYGKSSLNSNVDADGNLTTEFHKRLNISLSIYGGNEDYSHSIAEELRDLLLTDVGSEKFHTEVGCPLIDTSDINTSESVRQTDFFEVSTLDLNVGFVTTTVESIGTISEIDLVDSELKTI